MKISDITNLIEKIAPLDYQEDYDNSGLLVGDKNDEVSKILLSLDVTPAVVQEAINGGFDMIVSHHPVIFKGLKKLNGKTEVERVVILALRNNIALYAAHTNLDNVLINGVSSKMADKIGLTDQKILLPKAGKLDRIVVYAPQDEEERIRKALAEAGGGNNGNYSECSYTTLGKGRFRPGSDANPAIGEEGKREEVAEARIEVVAPAYMSAGIISHVKKIHSYEEMAYEITPMSNINQEVGSGIIGDLKESLYPDAFLELLKSAFKCELIRHSAKTGKISRVAVCGGAGSFLIPAAIAKQADAFITADLKYHEFFDLQNLLLCDIGHYESEISTLEIFYEEIQRKFPTFAVAFCETSTNPIQYFK